MNDVKELCDTFIFRKSDKNRLVSCKKNSQKALKELSRRTLSASRVYNVLESLSLEEVLFIRAKARSKLVFSRIIEFLAKHNNITIKIRGGDLKKLGIKPSPLYAKLLKEVLHEKIDGKISTKKQELDFVKRSFKK